MKQTKIESKDTSTNEDDKYDYSESTGINNSLDEQDGYFWQQGKGV